MTDAAKPPEPSRLAAVVDGTPLDTEAARALWTEFSTHMDEHVGDMAGFAKQKGWQSVLPEYQRGKAVLIVRTGGPMAKGPPAPKPPKPGPRPPAPPNRARQQAGAAASKTAGHKKKGPPKPQAKKGPPAKGKR